MNTSRHKPNAGFSLIEVLLVTGLVLMMMALLVPTFKGASDITKCVLDISGVLENARTYAMANNTYAWVGFFEENGSTPSTNPATSGTGRVVIFAVASRDGTSYNSSTVDGSHPAAFGANDPSNQVALVPINKPIKISNAHLAALNNGTGTGNQPARPAVLKAYQVGDSSFETLTSEGSVRIPTTFTYPLTTGGMGGKGQYTFRKIIEFNPQGEASKIVDGATNGPPGWIEIAVQPTHGSVVAANYAGGLRAAGAILVEGITGATEVFMP